MLVQEPSGQLQRQRKHKNATTKNQDKSIFITEKKIIIKNKALKLIIIITIITKIMLLSCPADGNSRRLSLSRKLHGVISRKTITFMAQLRCRRRNPHYKTARLFSMSVWSVETAVQQRWWRQQGRFLNRETRSCVGIAQLNQLLGLEVRQWAFKDGWYNWGSAVRPWNGIRLL